ncbi:MAG: PAS domain S-box protein [Ardenticatenaceae bacterium]|nr:PAS domain S-box protein [Ardenticatenaceae bacterium]MCB8987502.1 PAS domain S-box protein [Ardenticatenaceae bacterium]
MQRYLHLFANTGDSALAVDENQRIVYWNTAAEEVLGYTAEEAIGQYCWELLNGRTEEGRQFCTPNCAILQWIYDGKPIQHFNLIVKNRQRQEVAINISTIPLPTDATAQNRPVLVQLSRLLQNQPAWDGMLHVHLLGSLVVWRPDGSRVEGPLWRRLKVRALMAYLVLQRAHLTSREQLAELLWPDLPYESALRNLNTTVYNLRRSLEPDLESGADSRYIVYEGGYYRLAGNASHWLDTVNFEKLVRRARFAQDPQQAIRYYQEALNLYRGDYLADLYQTNVWSHGEHERFRQLHLTIMDELGALYEARQEDGKAKELYLHALAIDPCREKTCQKVMSLALRHGDRATAVSQCRRLTQAMQDDLNLMPSPETRQLCQELECSS